MDDECGLVSGGAGISALNSRAVPVFRRLSARSLGPVSLAGLTDTEAIRDYLDVKSSQMVWA